MADLDPHDNFIHDRYGYCYYSLDPEKTPVVYNLYTEPEYRRLGWGRKHLQHVINLIRDAGCVGAIDVVVQPREDSIAFADLEAFYKSLGLHIITQNTNTEGIL